MLFATIANAQFALSFLEVVSEMERYKDREDAFNGCSFEPLRGISGPMNICAVTNVL